MKHFGNTLILLFIFTLAINAQSQYSLSVMGDVNSPSGDMGDLYKTGFGGHAEFNYKLSRSWEIGLSVGYTKWAADDSYWSGLVSKVAGRTVDLQVDVPYSAVTLMLDVYYYMSSGSFRPYLTLSLGEHFAKIEANSITVDGRDYTIGQSASKSVGAYKAGVGFLYSFTPTMAVNLAAAYEGNGLEFGQSTTTSSGGLTETSSSSSTTLYINYSAGLTFAF